MISSTRSNLAPFVFFFPKNIKAALKINYYSMDSDINQKKEESQTLISSLFVFLSTDSLFHMFCDQMHSEFQLTKNHIEGLYVSIYLIFEPLVFI